VEREKDSSFEPLLLRDLEMGKKHIKVDQKRRIKTPFESFHNQKNLCLVFFWGRQALKRNKLFVVDYHDTYITYINKINAEAGRAFYASRTLMFLTSDGTLQVLAIELTLPPPASGEPKNSRVFLPPDDRTPDGRITKSCAWELAKTHVKANDSAFHQVVNH
jgi:hypothetical protein